MIWGLTRDRKRSFGGKKNEKFFAVGSTNHYIPGKDSTSGISLADWATSGGCFLLIEQQTNIGGAVPVKTRSVRALLFSVFFAFIFPLHAQEPLTVEEIEKKIEKAMEKGMETAVEDQRKVNQANALLLEGLQNLDVDTVRKALKEGASPRADAFWRVFFLAISPGIPEKKIIAVLEVLFNVGATLRQDDFGTAVLGESKLVIKYLLDRGADPNGVDSYPLKAATRSGREDIVNLLIKYGAEPLDPATSGQLRLVEAARQGDVKAMRKELSKGAKVNSRDVFRHTAMVDAVKYGNLEAVRVLLSLGGDPNLSGKLIGPCSPLHAAVLNIDFKAHGAEILKLLLKAGARVSSTACYKNKTPLHYAVRHYNAIPSIVVIFRCG